MKPVLPVEYHALQSEIDAGGADSLSGVRIVITDSSNQPTGIVYESGAAGEPPIQSGGGSSGASKKIRLSGTGAIALTHTVHAGAEVHAESGVTSCTMAATGFQSSGSQVFGSFWLFNYTGNALPVTISGFSGGISEDGDVTNDVAGTGTLVTIPHAMKALIVYDADGWVRATILGSEITQAELNQVIATPIVSYSATGTYAVGNIINYNDVVYRCITAITTGEAFTASKWIPITERLFVENTLSSGSFTILSTGIYTIGHAMNFGGSATPIAGNAIRIKVNGVQVNENLHTTTGGASTNNDTLVTKLNTGDVVTFFADPANTAQKIDSGNVFVKNEAGTIEYSKLTKSGTQTLLTGNEELLVFATATTNPTGIKADKSHVHAISDTSGLQTAIDLKAPLASPTLTGVIQLDGSPVLGDGANHGQRSFSDIAGASMLMTNTTGTNTTTIDDTDIAARFVKPGTASTKSNASMDIVIGSHTAGINPATEVKFRLGNSGNTPTTDILTLRSNGTVLVGSNAIPALEGTTTPVMDGTAAVGIATTTSKSDHVHPIDTTRETASNKLTAFQGVTDNTHYPSEKLVRDSLDKIIRNWTPDKDLTTGMQVMFRPEELPASGNITAWNDVSGNTRNLSQGGTASPVISGALLNGYRVAQFASGSDRLSTAAIPAVHGTEATIFAIFEHPSAAVSTELMGQVDTADGSRRRAYISPKWSDNNMYADVGNSAGSRMAFGNSTFVGDEVFHIMSIRRSGTTSGEIWRNGTSVLTDTTLDTPVAFSANMPFNVGNGDGTSEAFAGKIAEIIIYNTALTTAEREKIEGYLAHKYALQANLPVSHTYKSAAPAVITTDITALIDGKADNADLIDGSISGYFDSTRTDGVVNLAASSDLNLLTDNGVFNVNTPTNAPVSGGWWYVEHYRHRNTTIIDGNYAFQRAAKLETTANTWYHRIRVNGTWGSWEEIATMTDVNLKQNTLTTGQATLIAGTVTVSLASVVSTSRIFLTRANGTGVVTGVLRVGTITAGTSFVITSSDNTDTGLVNYLVV